MCVLSEFSNFIFLLFSALCFKSTSLVFYLLYCSVYCLCLLPSWQIDFIVKKTFLTDGTEKSDVTSIGNDFLHVCYELRHTVQSRGHPLLSRS